MTYVVRDVQHAGAVDRRASIEQQAEFYASYRDRLLRYARRHFGTRDAEEVTQEALVRAIATIDLDRPGYETWAWLTLVVRNIVIDQHRRRLQCDVATDDSIADADAPDYDSDPQITVGNSMDAALVRSALERIPHGQRRILWLYEVDRWSCPKIAEYLGHRENAVRQTLFKARRRLLREFLAVGGRVNGVLAPAVALLWRRSGKTRRSGPAGAAVTPLVTVTACVTSVLGLTLYAALPNSAPAVRIGAPDLKSLSARQTPSTLGPGTNPVPGHSASSHESAGTPAGRLATVVLRRGGNHVAATLGKSPFRPGRTASVDVVVETPVGKVEVTHDIDRAPGVNVVCSVANAVCTPPAG
jgi:RNA polymerase sigma factor (sigma-70 family)